MSPGAGDLGAAITARAEARSSTKAAVDAPEVEDALAALPSGAVDQGRAAQPSRRLEDPGGEQPWLVEADEQVLAVARLGTDHAVAEHRGDHGHVGPAGRGGEEARHHHALGAAHEQPAGEHVPPERGPWMPYAIRIVVRQRT